MVVVVVRTVSNYFVFLFVENVAVDVVENQDVAKKNAAAVD